MKKIIFFITHKTLTKEHAYTTLRSISSQDCDSYFDIMYIYNTHQEELPNDEILFICDKLGLNNKVNQIKIFDYDQNTKKTLGSDISSIINYVKKTYNNNDRVLLLKSDILLSKNYFNTVLNLDEGDIFFTSPFVCAKSRVTDDEMLDYINRDSFIKSDEITFFTEGVNPDSSNDFTDSNKNIKDNNVKFFSCEVVDDFSCHYITVNLLDDISIKEQSWGGVNFNRLRPYLIKSYKAFTLHKYHSIISTNRGMDRQGPVESWLRS